MIDTMLPTAVLTAAALMTLAAVFAVKAGVFAPMAEPQLAPGMADPSADTLAGSSELVRTKLAPRQPEWQTATLTSLSAVEDFLDNLEAHGVTSREVTILGSSSFAVRWK